MSALDTAINISETNLIFEDLKYCLVDANKRPYTIYHNLAVVNDNSEFVDFETILECSNLSVYAGLGVSVQASKLFAIDIDKCVSVPFDIDSINSKGLDIINMFKDFAYIEFSFSGTGIRILFKHNYINDIFTDYQTKFYIKNSNEGIEFYHHSFLARYVTVTGKYISNNSLSVSNREDAIRTFLAKYMTKKQQVKTVVQEIDDNKSIDELLKLVKYHYFKSQSFQDLWFDNAPGSGKDESERDYRLVKYLYTHITQNRDKLKFLFEQSDFFATKDSKHMFKWTRNNYRYFHYLFDNIKENL